MRRKLLRKDEEGLAILELALIMPLVLIFIFFIMEMGLLFFDYVSASNAVREGARCGAVGYHDAAVIQRVKDVAVFPDDMTVALSDRTDAGIGEDFQVTSSFVHEWVILSLFPTISWDTAVVMRLEMPGEDPKKAGLACGVAP